MTEIADGEVQEISTHRLILSYILYSIEYKIFFCVLTFFIGLNFVSILESSKFA